MNKRLAFLRLVFFLALAVFTLLTCQIAVFLFGEDYSNPPGSFSAYPDSGYYEIDPETILDTLSLGETDVFTPFLGDWDRDKPYYDSITWTQADFLKINNALSLAIWNEPLDLESWDIKYLSLSLVCKNNPRGFDGYKIVYFKSLGITKLERQYTTRLIEIYPWKGLIRWGGDASFSTPLLLGWDGIDLYQFEIMADDALQIAEKNGGADVRLGVDNICGITLRLNHNPPLKHSENWLVDYDRTGFYIDINPYTGEHKILSTGQ